MLALSVHTPSAARTLYLSTAVLPTELLCFTTHHRQRRWNVFRNAYLKPGTASPIGKIKRVWGRLEDQARASLHVHAAVWVEGDDCPEDLENPLPGIHGITCEAPRHTSTPAHLAWREAVLRWQTHRCWGKCTKGMGDVVLRRCKYDYPRPRTNFIMDSQGQKVLQVIPGKECILPATLNPTTERYVYPCTEEEDEWLSPYVPEWLLANGAAMNIQYVPCGSFLAYIAKYVAKPEPSGRIHVPHGVCQHNREVPRQLHFLQNRIVGAPEAVTVGIGGKLCHTHGCRTVSTALPHRHVRRLISAGRRRPQDDIGPSPSSIFADGFREKYMRRPRQLEDVLFMDYVSKYDEVTVATLPAKKRADGAFWRCLVDKGTNALRARAYASTSADAAEDVANLAWVAGQIGIMDALSSTVEDAHYPLQRDDYVVVKRTKPKPVYYRMYLPHRQGTIAFCYHLLLRHVPFRCDLPSAFITPYRNASGTLHEECALRGLLGPQYDLAYAVRSEALARCFSAKIADAMSAEAEEFAHVLNVLDGTYADEGSDVSDCGSDDENCPAAPSDDEDADHGVMHDEDSDEAGDDDDDASVSHGLHSRPSAGASHAPAPTPAPEVKRSRDPHTGQETIVWTERCVGQEPQQFTLTRDQAMVYDLLKDAPAHKALRVFLSGMGGTGKSVLVRLLVQHWRSSGLHVLVCAPTAKAARLVRVLCWAQISCPSRQASSIPTHSACLPLPVPCALSAYHNACSLHWHVMRRWAVTQSTTHSPSPLGAAPFGIDSSRLARGLFTWGARTLSSSTRSAWSPLPSSLP